MKLTKQQRKVYDYIKVHPGCTTRDIQRDIFVSCPSGRITELRQAGVQIVSVGHRKYPGAHPFEMYKIVEPVEWVDERKAVASDPQAFISDPQAKTLALGL